MYIGDAWSRVGQQGRIDMALDALVATNFPDNGCIARMSHGADALYCKQLETNRDIRPVVVERLGKQSQDLRGIPPGF